GSHTLAPALGDPAVERIEPRGVEDLGPRRSAAVERDALLAGTNRRRSPVVRQARESPRDRQLRFIPPAIEDGDSELARAVSFDRGRRRVDLIAHCARRIT